MAERASPRPEPMTVQEFLAWDDGTDARYELIAGCQCILLVFSDRRRVERWVRDGERWIVTDHIGESGSIAIPVLHTARGLS